MGASTDGRLYSNTNPVPVSATILTSNTSPVTITGTVRANPYGVAVDAFGRARVSTPLTLFDSSHRYRDNGLWVTSNSAGTTYTFSQNEGLINLNVRTGANQEIIRETNKVFSYQPGKSLQVLNTFVMNPAKTGLRQRIGYFGANNGIYLEQSNSDVYFVERNWTSGSLKEVRVRQADWNINTLLANSGSPYKSLDLSKAQILFTDIEWLGLGTVRCGFVLNGELVHCHSFHHANTILTTYMTTASLPLRYEIRNTAATATNSTLKQICSSVISEGGYELRGAQQAIGTAITSPRDLPTAGTFYPVISLRLKAGRLDAIVILTALSILAITNNAHYNWQVIENGTTTGGTWVSAGIDSSVEYNLTGTSFTGGRTMASGFTSGSNQGSASVDILKEALFKFQLERNGLTSTPFELTLIAASASNGADIYASMDWEEISR